VTHPAIHLASGSPRRKLLIEQMGLTCQVVRIQAEEPMDQDRHAADLAIDLSELKMKACLDQKPELTEYAWILTADTLIALDDEKIGKPEDRQQAGEILSRLQGRTHQVITAFSVYSPLSKTFISDLESTDVTFSSMDQKEIESYLDTKEWQGVAGAYRIQGCGGKYVSSLNGTFYNVMGLPINRFYAILRLLNFSN
jgi:septum formation protein